MIGAHEKAGEARSVGDHMTPTPLTIELDSDLGAAADLMQNHNIRHLPVLDAGELVGVLSDRDLGLIEMLVPARWQEISVAEAMSPEPYAVPLDAPLWEVARHMGREKFGCAVVVDGGSVVGVFTTVDALRLLARVAG